MAIETDRHLELHCSLGPDKLLVRRFSGSEQMGRCFEFTVTLLSDDHDIEMESLLGQHATVEVKQKLMGYERFYDGIVCEFSHSGTFGRYALYRMTLRPWLWLLSRNQDCRIFQKKSALDIIKSIFSDNGFSDIDEKLLYSYQPREYCVQYRESDLNFVSRLMEDEGIYYYFKHEKNKHTLVLSDSISAHETAPNCEKISFGKLEDASKPPGVFYEWSSTKRVQSGAVALTDYDFEKPEAELRVVKNDPQDHEFAKAEFFDYPGRYTEVKDGDNRARVRIEEFVVGYELADGATECSGIGCGNLFKLADHPRGDQNKDYLIVGAAYDAESGSFESGDSSGRLLYSQRVKALDKKTPFRPSRVTRGPVIPGAQTATVVGPKGQEIWTDEYGRVKVQFHWDREGKKDENSSCWIRVAHGWAGSRWGVIHVPRIDQEVVVEFLEGDPDQPMIVGCVYNKANKPPYDLPAHQTQSGIKTQSSKGGGQSDFNELRFEDDKGNEEVFLQAQKDHNVHVKNKMTVVVDESDYNTTVKVGEMTADVPLNTYRVTAKEILLEVAAWKIHMSATGITVEVGGSKIELTPATLSANSPMLKLNC